jgi:6-phosphogluconate dehydrogenase (decarboxylating)
MKLVKTRIAGSGMATDTPLQLGMVGLGRMGAEIGRRLMRDGHRCVGYDVNADVASAFEREAMAGARSVEEFAARLLTPRTAWVMLTAGTSEGRWTSAAAIEEDVPAPVLTSALYSRFSSRGLDDFADRALSAMRKQFVGHAEKAPG